MLNSVSQIDPVKVTGIVTVVIALGALAVSIAAWAATRDQAAIAQRTLAFSVFSRRWELFNETMNLLVESSGNGDPSKILNYARTFLEKTRDKDFMLSTDLQSLLAEVYSHAIKLDSNHRAVSIVSLESGDLEKRPQESRILLDKTTWLLAEVPRRFKRSLDFTDI